MAMQLPIYGCFDIPWVKWLPVAQLLRVDDRHKSLKNTIFLFTEEICQSLE